MTDEEKKAAYKARMKKLRREQYLKAKERFENSDYAKEMKEKQKRMRKLAYQIAKERRKKAQYEKEIREEEAKKAAREEPKEIPSGPPELRLIVNPDFED